MSKCHNILLAKIASLFQLKEKLKAFRNSKLNFSSSFFIVKDSHVNIVWLHVVVFSDMIFCFFETMPICLNIIQWKYLKIALILSIAQIKPVHKIPNFCLHEISKKLI